MKITQVGAKVEGTDVVSAPVKTHPRLTQLARASYIATAASALISVILFLIQVDVYLLNHPPIQVGDVAAAALKTVAALGTGLGVLATVVGLVLRRISKRLAQAEQKR